MNASLMNLSLFWTLMPDFFFTFSCCVCLVLFEIQTCKQKIQSRLWSERMYLWICSSFAEVLLHAQPCCVSVLLSVYVWFSGSYFNFEVCMPCFFFVQKTHSHSHSVHCYSPLSEKPRLY